MSIKNLVDTFANGFNGAKIKEKLKEEGKEISEDFLSGRGLISRMCDGFAWTWENTDFHDWYEAAKEATDFYEDIIRKHYKENKKQSEG